MVRNALSKVLTLLLLLPRLVVLGVKKTVAAPGKQLRKAERDLLRLPAFVAAAIRASVRRYF